MESFKGMIALRPQVWAALVGLSLSALQGPTARALEPSAEESSCPAVPGLEAVLDSARVLLVGEVHGTVESPGFVAALVCRAVDAGRSVIVGLEWVQTETERVNAYLESEGGQEAQRALLAGGIWQARGQAQYGATSEAMLGLLESLRELRNGGGDLGVYLFNRYGRGSQERDRLMANALAEQIPGSKGDLFVVLTGNIHSRLAAGTSWSPDFQPMGLLLQEAHPSVRIVSLDVAHAGGTAWLCIAGERCGAQPQRPRGEAADRPFTITFAPEVQPGGHHGTYFVGPIHASPPAVP